MRLCSDTYCRPANTFKNKTPLFDSVHQSELQQCVQTQQRERGGSTQI